MPFACSEEYAYAHTIEHPLVGVEVLGARIVPVPKLTKLARRPRHIWVGADSGPVPFGAEVTTLGVLETAEATLGVTFASEEWRVAHIAALVAG